MICNNDSYIANIDISKEMRLYDILQNKRL